MVFTEPEREEAGRNKRVKGDVGRSKLSEQKSCARCFTSIISHLLNSSSS